MLDLAKTAFTPIWEVLKVFGVPLTMLIVGGAIARTWQHRNWLTQQRIADQDKLNQETKKLFEDFVEISSKRHFRTKRLLWAVRACDKNRVEAERSKYDEVLYAWNEAELSWKVRFVKNLSNGQYLNEDIEERIRRPFVTVGARLENAIRKSKKSTKPSSAWLTTVQCDSIEADLNRIASSIFEIGREIYGKLDYLSDMRLDNDHIVRNLLERGQYTQLSVGQLVRATITSSSGRY